MSSVIDERVVQMEFDNDKFQKGVAETITSLNQLDNNIDKFTKNSSYFSGLENAVENLTNRFSASSMIINGILLSLGQRIEQTLNKLTRNLTNLIRSGYSEYETQMGSTQTILANVKDEGKGIEDVTSALDELNRYADLTIYNFTEMTKNIGLFTAAGTSLDDSVSAIKGLANAAAIAGVNSAAASRAWYQTSQAMSQGVFKLMDWKSLENAGIAGEQFRKVLEMVAKSEGVQIEQLKKRYGGFRNTLQSGWLTAKRFTEAMRIFSGEVDSAELKAKGFNDAEVAELLDIAKTAIAAATEVKTFTQLIDTLKEAVGSGWAQSFRTIFGDFEKAKEWLTGISNRLNDFIGEMADIRNDILSLIFDSGKGIDKGSESLHNIVDNLLTSFLTMFKAIRTGFLNIFPIERIKNAGQKALNFLEDFTGQFVVNERNILDQMYAQGAPQKVIDQYKSSVEAIDQITRDASNYSMEMVNTPIKNLMRIGRGIASIFDGVATVISDIFTTLFSFIPGSERFLDNINKGNKSILQTLGDIGDFITKFYYVFIKNGKVIPRVLTVIKNKIVELFKTNPLLVSLTNTILAIKAGAKMVFDYLKSINISPFDILIGSFKILEGAIGAAFSGIQYVFEKITGFIHDKTGTLEFNFFEKAFVNITKFMTILGELGKGTITFADVLDMVKAKFESLKDSFVNSKFGTQVIKIFDTVKKAFADFKDSVRNFVERSSLSDFIDTKHGVLIGVLSGVAALVIGAIKVITTLFKKANTITDLIASINGVLEEVSNVLNSFALKLKMDALKTAVNNVLKLAAGLLILSFIPYKNLVQGLTALAGVALVAVLVFKAFGKATDGIASILEASADKALKGAALFAKGVNNLLTSAGRALVLEAFSNAVLKLAIAFMALGVAFAINPEGMKKAAFALAIMVGVLGLIAGVLSNTAQTRGVKSAKNMFGAIKQFALLAGIAAVISAISSAVIGLSLSMIMLSKAMGPELLASFVLVIAMIGSLTLATWILLSTAKSMKTGKLFGVGAVIVAIAGAVLILAKALEVISKIDYDLLDVGVLFGSIITIAGMMALVETAYKKGSEKIILSFALMLGIIVGGLALLALSLKQLNGIKLDGTVIAALIASLVVIAGLPITLAVLTKKAGITNGKTLDNKIPFLNSLTLMIGTIAAGMVGLMLSLKLLDGVSVSGSIVATIITSLSLITGLVITVLALIRNTKITADQITLINSFSIFIGAIAGAMLLSALSLKILEGVTIPETTFGLFIGMLSVITVLTLVVAAIVAFAPNTKIGPIVAFSAFMVAFGATMILFATSLKMLEGVKIDTSTLIALGIMIAAVTIVTALVAGLGILMAAIPGIGEIAIAGIAALAATIAAIGFAVVSISAALYLLPIAVNGIIDTIIRIYNGMIYITEHISEIKETIENFVNAASQLGPTIYALFLALGVAFGSGLAGFLVGLASMGMSIALGFYSFIITLLQSITKILQEHGPEIIDVLHDLILTVANFAIDALDMVMTELLPQLILKLASFGMDLIASAAQLGGGIADAILEGIETLIPGASDIVDSIQEGLGWIVNGVSDVADYVKEKFGIISADIDNSDREIVSTHSNSMRQVHGETVEAMEGSAESVEENMESMESDTASGMSGIVSIFGSNSSKVLGYITSNFDKIKSMNKEELKDMLQSKAKEWGLSGDMVDKATDLIAGYVSDMADSNVKASADEGDAVNYNVEQAYKKYADTVERYESQIRDLQARAGAARANALAAEADGLWDAARGYWNTYNSIKTQITSLQNQKTFDLKLKWRLDNQATSEAEKGADSLSDIFSGLANDWNNFNLPDMDTSTFNYQSTVDTNSEKDQLKDAEKIAANAGDNIENSRADLTPVVDLDKLSSDLKKANGMAQSELLAAQNAAIGAYINTDSELNPFLKDRYQSVYNFTQNNYSPKSLSRIDIYRQTQRQLALSRGF